MVTGSWTVPQEEEALDGQKANTAQIKTAVRPSTTTPAKALATLSDVLDVLNVCSESSSNKFKPTMSARSPERMAIPK